MMISGPKPPPLPADSALVRAIDAEIARVQEKLAWEWQLGVNELLWGSAYGPWPKPNLTGLASLITETGA